MTLQPQPTRFLIGFPGVSKAEERNPTWQVTDWQAINDCGFFFSFFFWVCCFLNKNVVWYATAVIISSSIYLFVYFNASLPCLHLAVAHLEGLGCPGPFKSQKSWIWGHPCRLWHNPDLRWTFDELQPQKNAMESRLRWMKHFVFVCLCLQLNEVL